MPTVPVTLLVRRTAGRTAAHAGVPADHDAAAHTFLIAAAAVAFPPAAGDKLRPLEPPGPTRTVTAVETRPDGSHLVTAPPAPEKK